MNPAWWFVIGFVVELTMTGLTARTVAHRAMDKAAEEELKHQETWIKLGILPQSKRDQPLLESWERRDAWFAGWMMGLFLWPLYWIVAPVRAVWQHYHRPYVPAAERERQQALELERAQAIIAEYDKRKASER